MTSFRSQTKQLAPKFNLQVDEHPTDMCTIKVVLKEIDLDTMSGRAGSVKYRVQENQGESVRENCGEKLQ